MECRHRDNRRPCGCNSSPSTADRPPPQEALSSAHRLRQRHLVGRHAELRRLVAAIQPDSSGAHDRWMPRLAASAFPKEGTPHAAGRRVPNALSFRPRAAPAALLALGVDVVIAPGSITFTLDGGHDAAGDPVELHGITSELGRRQPDGTWK